MPRPVDLKGKPVELMSYYRCCETVEPSCDLVWIGVRDSFLVASQYAEPPFALWRKSGFRVPAGVRLLRRVAETPCTREPEQPHEWWDWEWVN